MQIAELLKGSDRPSEDQRALLKSQLLFWLIGAPDGHAKNFSIFLTPGGRYRLTPFYDVLTGQPAHDSGQIRRKSFKLAMSVGRHYRMDEVAGRHFVETAARARISPRLAAEAMEEVQDRAAKVFDQVLDAMPANFPEALHESVRRAADTRLRLL